MRHIKTFKVIFFLCLLSFPFVKVNASITPNNLRCENKIDPLGITLKNPRLSWELISTEKNQSQTSCQILIATSTELLKKDEGDIWNSNKIFTADQSVRIDTLVSLHSNSTYFWKVRVWNQSLQESEWSNPSQLSIGLLNKQDWEAVWISRKKDNEGRINLDNSDFLKGAKWIWEESNRNGNDSVPRYFYKKFDLDGNTQIQSANIMVTADEWFELYINEEKITQTQVRGEWDRARLVDVSNKLHNGENTIMVKVVKSTPGIPTLLADLKIINQNGQVRHILTDSSWQSINAETKEKLYEGKEIGEYGCAPWGKIYVSYEQQLLPPANYFRKDFQTIKTVKRAIIYATAKGIYNLYLNGEKVGNDLLAPGWTNYDKRIHVQAYDITKNLKQGQNTLGSIVADGWYAGYVGCKGQRSYYGNSTSFLSQLMIEYTDGTKETISTDDTWKVAEGAIREADILRGETVDAHLEQKGWNTTKFDDSLWENVNSTARDETILESHPGEPVRVIHEFKPTEITEPQKGVYVFKMAQNFAGLVRLKLTIKKDQKIQLRYAERLNPDGTIYTENLRTARATDRYISDKSGILDWTPQFTFHGFQYVELTGVDEKPNLDAITGLAISSNTPVAGSFQCSNPLVNQIYSNIYWTQRMNFIDIPTDCPQRDERQGWTGDAQVYVKAATLNTDVQSFFTKWIQDLMDEQYPNGDFPCTAPLPFFGTGGAAWADAGIVCPWTIFDTYNDKQLIGKYYKEMANYIALRRTWFDDNMNLINGGCIGDWLNINDDTPTPVLVMCYTAHSVDLMARMATALGKKDDAENYAQFFKAICKSFEKNLVDKNGHIQGNSQSAYALPISLGMLSPENEKKAADHLVELIKNRGWNLSTGFLGTKHLLYALSKTDHFDIAYRLLTNESFPSWGFSIKNGATTIWERWNGWTPEDGFFDPSMNSFAHYSFGAIYEWMVENIGGIKNLSPGYKTFQIKPVPSKEITHAKVTYHSIYGEISSDWKMGENEFTLIVSIPANSRAKIYVPANSFNQVYESGSLVKELAEFNLEKTENGYAIFNVGSGTYHFQSKITN